MVCRGIGITDILFFMAVTLKRALKCSEFVDFASN